MSELFAVVRVDFGANTLDMPELSDLSLMSKIMLNLSTAAAAVYYCANSDKFSIKIFSSLQKQNVSKKKRR